jgi:proline iminopeptidase
MASMPTMLGDLDRRYPPDRTGHVAVRGGRVWYRLDGARHQAAGRTPILVVHGGPGLSHFYLLTLAALADHWPVIFYDQLDCGFSDRPNQPANWTVARFVDEVAAVRRALGLDRVILVGHSFGGSLAIEHAAAHGEGVVGLVLASPLISTPRWIADNTAHRDALPDDVKATLAAHEAAGTTDSKDYHAAVMVFMRRHFCRLRPSPDELKQSYATFNARLYDTLWGPTEFHATGPMKRYDASPLLGRLRAPTLFLCGRHDESTPEANRLYAAQVPGARLVVFEDASHCVPLEQPDGFLATVGEFLAAVDTP